MGLPALSQVDRVGYVADLLHESQGAWYRPEAVVLVEAVGRAIGRIDNDEPCGNDLSRGDDSPQGVCEESPANP
ncbi:hypothetical protein ACNTMW_09470 [Planosporangium sp. 12N6]|uniref:hypothetical protein n=1 Tax=Planosporangium spinosum TaxID=3402278 RepID=UPI003CF2B39E